MCHPVHQLASPQFSVGVFGQFFEAVCNHRECHNEECEAKQDPEHDEGMAFVHLFNFLFLMVYIFTIRTRESVFDITYAYRMEVSSQITKMQDFLHLDLQSSPSPTCPSPASPTPTRRSGPSACSAPDATTPPSPSGLRGRTRSFSRRFHNFFCQVDL